MATADTHLSIDDYAATVDDAARHAQAIPQFADTAFDVDMAYAIQAASIARRLARGEVRTGIKMGFTSKAKMQQMGVHDLIWGRLTDQMLIDEGGAVPFDRFIHPRVEPEIAFMLCDDLCGRVTIPEAMAAVEAVAPALEVIDSRYENFKFSLPDVVADNASSSAMSSVPGPLPKSRLKTWGSSCRSMERQNKQAHRRQYWDIQ